MLNAKVVSLKRHGKENVKHKPAIETEDLVRLKSSHVLSPTNPLGVVVAQEKTASFLQSVFSNCTVHGSVNIILNYQNP